MPATPRSLHTSPAPASADLAPWPPPRPPQPAHRGHEEREAGAVSPRPAVTSRNPQPAPKVQSGQWAAQARAQPPDCDLWRPAASQQHEQPAAGAAPAEPGPLPAARAGAGRLPPQHLQLGPGEPRQPPRGLRPPAGLAPAGRLPAGPGPAAGGPGQAGRAGRASWSCGLPHGHHVAAAAAGGGPALLAPHVAAPAGGGGGRGRGRVPHHVALAGPLPGPRAVPHHAR